jgi:hypothetical protein
VLNDLQRAAGIASECAATISDGERSALSSLEPSQRHRFDDVILVFRKINFSASVS